MTTFSASRSANLPVHGWAGLVMISVFWALNWGLDGPRTHVYFFPLWLGYILAVDGIVLVRRGTSIFTRSRREFLLLFAVSAPAWWLFELINAHTRNWTYVGAELFTDFEYAVLATMCFSTVIPAVFETAELVRSFRWVNTIGRGLRIEPSPRTAAGYFLVGCIFVALLSVWPNAFYPFIWGVLFFLIEPINVWRKQPALLETLRHGDWRTVVSLSLGALICGFFWEFWNYFAYPKWTYRTPGVEFLHLFEMPLLGYLGYLPFGLELYTLGRLARGRLLNVHL